MNISARTIGGLFLVLALLAPPAAFGAEITGKYSAALEGRETRDGIKESVLVNYLSFDVDRLPLANLSLHGLGKYAHEWRENDSATSIYYLYGQHRTFEGRRDLLVGRFPLESHRFLTLDGLHLTMRPDRPWGYSLYAGQPRYMEIHNDRFERQFRDTGDYLAGGKVFLRGVEGLRANASYSREGDGSTVYRELIGIGGGKDFFFPRADEEMVLALDGSLDYNPAESALDKLSARLFLLYSAKLRVVVQADRFDVREDYPAGRELIISLFSTGREDRAQYTITYDLRPEISLYQGTVFTEMEMPDGTWRQGRIIKGGISGNYRERWGVGFDAGLYHFDSHSSDATGLALNLNYWPAEAWFTQLGLEVVKIDAPFRERERASSVIAEVGYQPGNTWRLAGYLERSDNPEFKNDFRTGIKLDYLFGFAFGRARQQTSR